MGYTFGKQNGSSLQKKNHLTDSSGQNKMIDVFMNRDPNSSETKKGYPDSRQKNNVHSR